MKIRASRIVVALAACGISMAGAAATVPPFPPPMTAAEVITVLDQTVDWYRTLGVQQQAANQPSDLLILYDNRQTANRVLALAFEVARADADLLAKLPTGPPEPGTDVATSSRAQSQLQAKLDAQGAAVQAELDAQHHSKANATGKSAVEVQAKINELQGELDLINTKKSILVTMSGFNAGAGSSGQAALKAQIDAMSVAFALE